MPGSAHGDSLVIMLMKPEEQEFTFVAKDRDHYDVWVQGLTQATMAVPLKKGGTGSKRQAPPQIQTDNPSIDQGIKREDTENEVVSI